MVTPAPANSAARQECVSLPCHQTRLAILRTLCDFSKLFAPCVFGNFPAAYGWLSVGPDAA